MNRTLACSAALLVGLTVGCRPQPPKLPSLPAAFANLPLPPNGAFVGRSGSEDALVLTFNSPMSADSVTGYYRSMFKADTLYHVLGDSKGAVGEQAFYLETTGRPLWIRIRPEAGASGSIVELTGAVVPAPDSAAAKAAVPAPAAK
ncbi:MAG: hypothetical protein ACHQXA_10685 [Gemmatimonadales bacterium]|jgi:hypothetical protein